MPQLDLFTYSTIILYVMICFIFICFFMENFVTPKIFEILRIRVDNLISVNTIQKVGAVKNTSIIINKK